MARRKVRRSRSRTVFSKVRNYQRKTGNVALMGNILGSGVYGALRSKIANMVQPLTNSLPFGNIADEVAMGGIAVLMKKTIKNRYLTPVLNGAIAIESARIGEAIALGQIGIGGSSNTNSQQVYG